MDARLGVNEAGEPKPGSQDHDAEAERDPEHLRDGRRKQKLAADAVTMMTFGLGVRVMTAAKRVRGPSYSRKRRAFDISKMVLRVYLQNLGSSADSSPIANHPCRPSLPHADAGQLVCLQLHREVFMTSGARLAEKLRWWSEHRGLSQLALAGRAGISQRHMSFLELWRASPSSEMVDRLAAALDMPLS